MNLKVSAIVFLLLFGSSLVQAQGYMSSPGFSGKHAQFRTLDNRHSQSFEVMPGYTFNGRFSISFGLGVTNYRLSKKLGFSFSQKLSALILKQSYSMPLSLGVNIDFQKGFIDSDIAVEDNPISQFSLSLHHAYRGINKMQFIPSIEVGNRQEIKRIGGPYDVYSDYFFAASLTYGYTYFYAEPKVVFHDENTYFQLSVGVFIL